MPYNDYYPYGKILREYANGPIEKFLTTQHERDLETGLDYRGARFYDSDVGRFLSLDPLAADYPSLSDYSYVAGNPIYLIDPDGEEPIKPEIGTVQQLHSHLIRENVQNAVSFFHAMGSGWTKNAGYKTAKPETRYIYTKGAGWVDMKHFAGGAYATHHTWSGFALWDGEGQEEEQQEKGDPSAWSYEDLTSNMLGIYFQAVYRYSDEAKDLSYVEALKKFMNKLGAVENWKEEAPNAEYIAGSYAKNEDSGVKDYTYRAYYETDSENTLMQAVYLWLIDDKGIDPDSNRSNNAQQKSAKREKNK